MGVLQEVFQGKSSESWVLPAWMEAKILGIEVWQIVLASCLLFVGLILKRTSDYAFEDKIIPLLKRSSLAFGDLVANAASKPLGYLFFLLSAYGAVGVLSLPIGVNGFVVGGLRVAISLDVVWFFFRAVDILIQYLQRLIKRTDSRLDDQIIPLLRRALKVVVCLIGAVWTIQLLGYEVSSLLAGLGIGGLAIALALQDTLANFFGSIFIFMDRPFVVGDWIKVGDVEGSVEDIGFRSTRIRTFTTTLVSIPNKMVAEATIDNWSRMPKRRIKQTIGLSCKTSARKMEDAVQGIRRIVEGDPGVDTDMIIVRFSDFTESSLNVLVLYFTKAIAYNEHMETKERINLSIMKFLDSIEVEIASSTRTLVLDAESEKRIFRQDMA